MRASNDPPDLDGLPEGAFLAAPASRRVTLFQPLRKFGVGGALPITGGSPNRPPRRANHAASFSLLMGSSRKNGRLGDPALPSVSSTLLKF